MHSKYRMIDRANVRSVDGRRPNIMNYEYVYGSQFEACCSKLYPDG